MRNVTERETERVAEFTALRVRIQWLSALEGGSAVDRGQDLTVLRTQNTELQRKLDEIANKEATTNAAKKAARRARKENNASKDTDMADADVADKTHGGSITLPEVAEAIEAVPQHSSPASAAPTSQNVPQRAVDGRLPIGQRASDEGQEFRPEVVREEGDEKGSASGDGGGEKVESAVRAGVEDPESQSDGEDELPF